MALISCPNCGKQISDTSAKCFHCGHNLVKNFDPTVPLIEFKNLTVALQKELENEFYKLKSYGDYMKKNKLFEKTMHIGWIVSLIFCLFAVSCIVAYFYVFEILLGNIKGYSEYEEVRSVFMGAMINLSVVSIVSVAIILIVRHTLGEKHNINRLIILKNFQKWLSEEKGIDYLVHFGDKKARDKELFDKIDINKDKVEV